MEPLLRVNDLRISYHTYQGEVQAVRGVSFSIERGETIAIVGESGCGKSVCAKSILRLIKDPGEIMPGSQILFSGKDVLSLNRRALSHYRGEDVSIIFQDALASLNPTMQVGKQIAESLVKHQRLSRRTALNRAVEILQRVGIPDAKNRAKLYPHEFSGGQRQRIMIGIAFACQPRLLIADEPTTALDVTVQSQIMSLLQELQKQHGTSIMLITHDLGIVAGSAKRIYVMYAGQIVEQGLSKEIFYHPQHPYTMSLLRAVPRVDLGAKSELTSIEGAPPDLIAPPAGCPFSTRCDYCMNICRKQAPSPTLFSGSHSAQCWLHHPMAAAEDNPFRQEDHQP